MPKISVLIPAYNAEQYLPRCLDSVIGQSLEDIEIIVVNDGSIDGTKAILEDYASRDSRIKLIDHPENRGTLWTRITAIDASSGKYVTFVDADDELAPDGCEVMYRASEATGADFLVADSDTICIDGKVATYKNELKYGDSSYYLALSMARDEVCIYPWAKLFARELFSEHPLERIKDINSLDDAFMCFHLARFVKKAVVIKDRVYKYYRIPTSITNIPLNDVVMNSHIFARTRIFGFCEEIEGRKNGPIKRLEETMLIRYVFNCIKKGVGRKRVMDKAAFHGAGYLFTLPSMIRHLGPWKGVTFYLATHYDLYSRLLYGNRCNER